MKTFRNVALILGVAVLTVGVANQAKAGFLGDTVSVSLTVHTTGAIDQTVWSSTPAVVAPGGPELTGDSWPNGVGTPLAWELDLEDLSILITVINPTVTNGPTTIDPLLLTISGLDSDILAGATVDSIINGLGVAPADVSVFGDTLTVSSPVLNILPAGYSSLTTKINLAVPEASSVLMTLMAGSVAGGYLWRRRRTS